MALRYDPVSIMWAYDNGYSPAFRNVTRALRFFADTILQPAPEITCRNIMLCVCGARPKQRVVEKFECSRELWVGSG